MNTSWLRWMFIWDEGEDLYLGKAMPRYWLADGKQVKIERAADALRPDEHEHEEQRGQRAASTMTIDPPTRKRPRAIYARFRHPDGKTMNRVTVNGKPWQKFDPEKEWVVLPALNEKDGRGGVLRLRPSLDPCERGMIDFVCSRLRR